MRKATFSGASVYLSRSLVEPPEVYDAVHDALKLNGATVFLCCDPSRNSPLDFHVISDPRHEKFELLKSKGCNLLGPQCILSCAKEHRVLPKQGYTCCLAMDGVKVLASGFERDKKAIIGQLVTAMGGVVLAKPSLDVNFVIVKDVLAAKYRYSLNVLKKPIVNLSWLFQCSTEHRVVPHEPFRMLPFTGLTVCVTRIPQDERKEIGNLIIQNGGRYSADLTKNCTHLVSDAPVGDKYVVAQRWGQIRIVNRKWVDQSIAKKGCLDEGLYAVDIDSKSCNDTKSLSKEQCCQEPSSVSSQQFTRSVVEDLEATQSQNIASSFSDAREINNDDTNAPTERANDARTEQLNNEPCYESRVAEDSEAEDNDLYLSNCRIFLAGFAEKEQSKLVNMIRKGGGTRHMLLSEKLTHIILGAPSETERREVRRLAAWGVIHVVNSSWLEECDRTKRELSVFPRHIASEPRVSMEPSLRVSGVKKGKCSTSVPCMPKGPASEDKLSATKLMSENGRAAEKFGSDVEKFGSGMNNGNYAEIATKPEHSFHLPSADSESKKICRVEPDYCIVGANNSRSSGVFKKKTFYFSSSFPLEQRPEVTRWIMEGGGVLLDDQRKMKTDFIVERHGLHQFSPDVSHATVVSTHWIRSSLDEGCMQDIRSHILYSPLHCHTPLAGFECLRFCVSQYEDRDRLLLKNLCLTLGAKFSSKLIKKVTHLLCKFTNGPKYEAACNWGIQSVTAEWITECIRQDRVMPPDPFRPRPVTAEDREAGLCTVSQYPTQAANMVCGHASSQLLSQSQVPTSNLKVSNDNSSAYGKRPRLHESNDDSDGLKKKQHPEVCGVSNLVPDVADAIEDLLAHSTMIQDMKLPSTSSGDQSIFSSDHSSILGQNHTDPSPSYGISRHWLNRTGKQEDISYPVGHEGKVGTTDSYSETQTDSQVVGYEEDLTGRQKIIDRVRSQTLTLTPDK